MTRDTRRIVPALVRALALAACLLLSLRGPGAWAQSDNLCDQPGEAPDVIVGDITARVRWGSVGDITAFSLGDTPCSIGTCWLKWSASTSDHPVMAQNMFRLENGRFEQIGQSWVMHKFIALPQSLCVTGCIFSDGAHLGVNCSTSDSASFGGYQPRLGPKFEVNPWDGVFPFPATSLNDVGDAIYKRLQVHTADLDPALHPGASYWVEVQYVTRDDASLGNTHNNASHRSIDVIGSSPSFDIALTGETVRTKPAIEAWKASDPDVALVDAPVPSDGRFLVGARVTPTVSGYHYEYAVQNLNSHRSARTFSVPVPDGAAITNIGFHDVDYHSGEPFSIADWTSTISEGRIVWATETHAENLHANALRWGTLYNFRFDSVLPPGDGHAGLGLFLPGVPGEITAAALVPCGSSDADADSHRGACDCDDAHAEVWATPGEARDVLLSADGSGATAIAWSPPASPGGSATVYDVIRTLDPSDFVTAAVCLPVLDPPGAASEDLQAPPPGGVFSYLVRAKNACPSGSGALGSSSGGAPRTARSCE